MAVGLVTRTRRHLGTAFVSLRLRDFRYLTLSSLILGFGQWFQQIGLGVLVYEMTESGTQMGLIGALRGGVNLVASPLGGLLSDRFSRRTIIIVATAVGVAQAVALALLVAAELARLWHLYAFAFVEGFATGVNQPARQVFVRDVTDEGNLANAVALNSIANNAARVSGPPLAGVIYGFLGGATLFLILAGLKAVAMVLTMMISRRTRQVIVRQRESAWRSLWEGTRYAFQDRTILALLVVGGIPSLLIYPYVQMLPFFAYDVLGRGAQGYGWLASALGWGSLGGLVLLALVGDFRRKGLVMLGTLFLYALLIAAFAQSEVFLLSMAFLIVAGVFHGPSTALTNTLLLLRTRPEMMGRVMALNAMTHGLQPLGSIVMGVAIDRWGAPDAVALLVLVGGGVILATAALSSSLRRA